MLQRWSATGAGAEMGRSILIAVMCIALIGCQVSTAPKRVAVWDQKHAASLMRAPWNGQFTLYRLTPQPNGQRQEMQSVHLKKGDSLGFRQYQKGVLAVANQLELPLSDGTYEWVMRADPGQIDPVTTLILIASVAAAVVTTVLLAVAVSHIKVPLNFHR